MRYSMRLLLSLALLLLALGCDSRGRAIRDALPAMDQARFDNGARVASKCWVCHDFYGNDHKIGPALSGVFGRPAGSAAGFGYSPALSGSGLVWDESTLRTFLSDVQGTVPGNDMNSPNVSRGPDLDALIFYMRQVTQPAETR